MAYFSLNNDSTNDSISDTTFISENAYVGYTFRQLETMAGPKGEELKTYWKNQVNTCPTLNLPFDFPRPRLSTFQGDVYLDTLEKKYFHQIVQMAERLSCQPFSIVLAVFYIFLGRLTGQTDIPIGLPVSTSSYDQQSTTNELVGMIANSLLCRVDLSGNPSFQDFLKRVEQALDVVYTHRDYPLWLLTQEGCYTSTDNPLLSVSFSWEKQYFSAQTAAVAPSEALVLEPYPLGEQRGGSFDLYLTVLETSQGVQLCWKYSSDLFRRKSVIQFAKRFRLLLAAVTAEPKQPIFQLPFLTEAEQAKLLKQANTLRSSSPPQQSIHALFEAQVQRTPDAIAIVSGDESLSYRELNQRANQLARYLQEKNLQPETLIGIYLQRSIHLIIALLGVLKAGAAYLPLNPDLPQERRDYMLQASHLRFLLSDSCLSRDVSDPDLEVICLDTDWQSISQQSHRNLDSTVLPQTLAYVIYTSGSTGKPKGVMVEHQAVANFIQAAIAHYELTTDDRVLQFASISFDAAVEEIYPCLSSGGTLILRSAAMLDSMPLFLNHCRDYRLTILDLPTAFWHQLVDFLIAAPNTDIPDSVRLVIIGGEKVDAQHIHDWYHQLNNAPPVVNTYGPTEATVVATLHKIPATQLSTTNIPIGKALSNIETYVLDEQAQLVPSGAVGELYIGGIALARGYLNAPDQTQARFIAHPFVSDPKARLYKTGDLVRYLPDGNLEYIGRADHQIKIRGYRVELGEIEAVITQHPEVKQALVIAQRSAQSQYLVAYVVSDAGVEKESPPTCLEKTVGNSQKAFKQYLRQYMETKLPTYMVPSAIVLLDTLPLTVNGKVDRSALPSSAINDGLGAAIPSEEAPKSPLEVELAQLWQKILGCQNIGIHTSLLELGGHSLQIIEILTQVQLCFGVQVPTQSFLKNPTIAQLTAFITAQQQPHQASLDPVTVNLAVEAQLDQDIQFNNLPVPQKWQMENIFLTGGTGSIGPYLLSELLQQTAADMYCLVRTQDLQLGKQRIMDSLKAARLWQSAFEDRIVPVRGDLAKPLLGLTQSEFKNLAEQIDVIYHNGAWVNFVYDYASLKDVNVLGTQEILRLAGCQKMKPVHYVSTLSIFSEIPASRSDILETDLPSSIADLGSGYDQTKCVAEHLIHVARSRGLPASIYRLGTVLSPNFQDGVAQLSPNFFKSLIQDCLQLRKIPDLRQIINLTPIDYIGKTIAYLSYKQPSANKTFHVINPNYLTWDELYEALVQLAPSLQKVSYSQWLAQLSSHMQQDKPSGLRPFLSLLDLSVEFPLENFRFNCENTRQGLADTAIESPIIDADVLKEYWPNLFNLL